MQKNSGETDIICRICSEKIMYIMHILQLVRFPYRDI